MDEIKIGDYGEASFRYEKKGFKGHITAFGTIKDIDGRYLLFEDNDSYPYLVRKDKIKFVKHDKSHVLSQNKD